MSDPNTQVATPQKIIKGSTSIAAVSVLGKTILGVGLFAMPYLLNKLGFVLGTVLILISACMSAFTLHLMSCVSMKNGKEATYYSIACETFPKWRYIVDGIILFKCIGAGTLYLIAASQAFVAVVPAPEGWNAESWRSLVAFLTTMLISTPLSFPKRARTLKIPNYFALGAMFYICGLIVGVWAAYGSQKTYIDKNNNQHETHFNYVDSVSLKSIVSELPTLVFAFTCHQNVVTITNELKHRSVKRMLGVIGASAIFGTVFYIICGYGGFFLLGDAIQSKNILNDIARFKGAVNLDNIFVKIGNIMFWLAMAMSFPMQCLPGRASLWVLIYQEQTFERQQTRNLLKVLSFSISMLCGGIAAVFSDLGPMFAVVGSLGSNVMSFILPSAMYLASFHSSSAKEEQALLAEGNVESSMNVDGSKKAIKTLDVDEEDEKDWLRETSLTSPPKWKAIGACFTLTFGILLAPLGVYLALANSSH
eukprot:GDKJ01010584.1.p1 GENE.GDKJ01010584.1~~GDKJ01010584.1.p1  ORF type:complete len:478 (-),score=107.85 GDKJ01010584.1:1129-2562(-)